ncbi:PREDICTED: progestin and adipoQ receptor family member 6 [Corvus brachyrhynchos]|uniref:progestin and adipoQ receptor family member 6 n=1 Tax=Corvus brachyrhynchos TaxID=85066 RepID=UPI0008164F5B|nr:PREDICTED: progestin and adipoQ receptor family member 6 [Corvus brachyrhynchos]
MDLHLALSPALALPSLVAFKVQCPEPPSSGPSSAGGSRVPPVHEAARLPVGAYTMPDSWLSDVWHCCFVPVAVLNSFICTGLSCYSKFLELERPQLSKVLQAAFMCPFLYDSLLLFYRVGWVAQGKSRVPPLQGWPGCFQRVVLTLLPTAPLLLLV